MTPKTLRQKRIIAIISLIITLILFLALAWWLTRFLLRGGSVESFKELIKSYGSLGWLVAFGIQVLQVIVSPIPGEVVELGMGICFGWFWGAVLCLVGSALGSVIIMFIVKKVGIKMVQLFVSVDKINELRFINSERKLNSLVFILYVLPGTPKDPLIFFFGLTRIGIIEFTVISTLARIPSVITSTVGGKLFIDGHLIGAVIVIAVTAVISLAGMILYQRILRRIRNRKSINRDEESAQE